MRINGEQMIRIKQLRAAWIATYCKSAGYAGVSCLTCGTTGVALIEACRKEGLECRVFSNPCKWWGNAEFIKYNGTQFFDATSGHIPLFIICQLGKVYREYLGEISEETITVPTGSGETALSLRIAYPDKIIIAQYGESAEIKRDTDAPLNAAVDALCVPRLSDI